MTKHYWHSTEFKHILRGVASRYPKTYQRIGRQLEANGIFKYRGLNRQPTKEELQKEFFAFVAAMPPHIIPFYSFGNDKKWQEIDWFKTYQLIGIDP